MLRIAFFIIFLFFIACSQVIDIDLVDQPASHEKNEIAETSLIVPGIMQAYSH